MTQIISTGQGGLRKTYCVECADSKPEILIECERADDQGELAISERVEDALGEECASCHRSIDQVRAEPHSYRVKAAMTIEVEFNVEAKSAIDAQYAVSWALAKVDIPEVEIIMALAGSIPSTEMPVLDEWTYTVEPAKVIPPEQNLFVTPAQERGYY